MDRDRAPELPRGPGEPRLKCRVEAGEAAEAAREGDVGDGAGRVGDELVGVGEPRVGHEGDEGLARVPEKLAAKGGPTHAAPPYGLVERERLGKPLENPLHDAVHPRPGGAVFHGGHARLTERHGVRVLRVLEQGQQFQEQSRAGQFAVRRHAVEQGEGGRGDGGAEAQTATGGAGQSPHLVAPAEVVEHEVGRQVELQGESGGAAQRGQPLLLEVNAARSKSLLDSRIEVLDAAGRPVEQVVLQATRDSWFTFLGKDSTQSGDFRLQNWMEMELDEYLYANGEVVRLWRYPLGPDSGFTVYPGSGNRRTFFSTSAVTHALGEPAWIVEPLPQGSTPVPNGLPVFKIFYENDDEPEQRFGADSQLLFNPPADGDYVVRLTDVRGAGAESKPDDYHYSLTIRPPQPAFTVAVGGKDPKVSPGSGRELTFTATRTEGFEGSIRVGMENLPAGFAFSGPVEIEAGQQQAIGVLSAAADAAAPDEQADKAVVMKATATIAGREVTQEIGTLGDIQIAEKPKVTVAILPGAGPASATQREGEPLEFSIRPGQTITARVKAQRHDFAGRIELGGAESGRNLPYGVFVDNIGLNGLLIVEGQDERDFFMTASPIAKPCRRLFHLHATADGGQASVPVVINVLPPETPGH